MTSVAPALTVPTRSPLPIQRKRHALAVQRLQLAVQRRRVHQHNRAQQVGRNVVAEVDNRRAGRRQRLRAVGLVVRAVTVSSAALANPSSSTVRLVVDTTRLGTESAATVTVTVEDEVSPSWSVIV